MKLKYKVGVGAAQSQAAGVTVARLGGLAGAKGSGWGKRRLG